MSSSANNPRKRSRTNSPVSDTASPTRPGKRQRSNEPASFEVKAGARKPAVPEKGRLDKTGSATSNGAQKKTMPDELQPARPRTMADVRREREQNKAREQKPSENENERPRDRERNAFRNRRRRSRSPRSNGSVPDVYRRRTPPREEQVDKEPTRNHDVRDDREDDLHRDRRPQPPPQQNRRGGRNILAEQERLTRERAAASGPQQHTVQRGVQGAVNQWYNTVPEYVKERGRDWRKNESKIKGLRSFNNWVKSCIIQKFSPQDKAVKEEEELGWGEEAKEPEEMKPLLVLDMGCGKGGDLGKWEKCPQPVGLYMGLDPADVSIQQAQERYNEALRKRRTRFDAQFAVKDCFGEWLGDLQMVQNIGIDPDPVHTNRWGKGGGFDIVTMMFSMHYSFESQEKVEMMLRNVSGALKKGGRFIGVCPNSDVLSQGVVDWYKKHPDQISSALAAAQVPANGQPTTNGTSEPVPPSTTDSTTAADTSSVPTPEIAPQAPTWGNSIYSVTFPPPNPTSSLPPLDPISGAFRPPFAHKYTYFIAEAVDVPEFVVPWEAFRAIAERFGLEQRYRKGFLDIWAHETDPKMMTHTGGVTTGADQGGWGQEDTIVNKEEQDNNVKVARELEMLGVRMGVIDRPGGSLLMTEEEKEAVAFYHGFCFVKT